MKKIIRYGYGNNFNDLFIEDDIIIKKSKNDYGNIKINYEMNFYKYIIDNNINFSIPKIINFGKNFYTMKYLKNTKPLYLYLYDNNDSIHIIINKIYKHLKNLHSHKIKIDEEKYLINLKEECLIKIKKRIKEIDINIQNLDITKVNGINILNVNDILLNIENYLEKNINKKDYFSLIHGDLNFNNILIDVDNEELYFIDPRGFFGKEILYGVEEYDYAKILFSLSGYDLFDAEKESYVEIKNKEIIFEMKSIMPLKEIIIKNNLETFLMITIWLGNAHCFKNNYNKCLKSYYYSLYLATIFFCNFE